MTTFLSLRSCQVLKFIEIATKKSDPRVGEIGRILAIKTKGCLAFQWPAL